MVCKSCGHEQLGGNFCGVCGNVIVKKVHIRKKKTKFEKVFTNFLILLGLTLCFNLINHFQVESYNACLVEKNLVDCDVGMCDFSCMPRFYFTGSTLAFLSKYFMIFATPIFIIKFIIYKNLENKK